MCKEQFEKMIGYDRELFTKVETIKSKLSPDEQETIHKLAQSASRFGTIAGTVVGTIIGIVVGIMTVSLF